MSKEVPARKASASSISCKFSSSATSHRIPPQTPLQVLVQLGFPKHRAEKALAATGNRGPQFASEWLLNHVNDPTLDESTQREYILYLCPSGRLLEQIDKFYAESLAKYGFNAAHNYLPHITLCSFFPAPDDAASLLVAGLEHAVDKMRADLPVELSLDFYRSNQFIGLFLLEQQNDIFKRLANVFMRECSEFIPAGELGPMHVISTCFPWCSSYPSLHPRRIEVEPYLKSLHLTLAYQFPDDQREGLAALAEASVDPSSPTSWELRLFSRESRVKGCHVYRVLEPHSPAEPDELELIVGDVMYVNPSDLKEAVDEWVTATSWLTGCTGQIPLSLTERTAESAAWTLHKSIVLSTHVNGCHSSHVPHVPNVSHDDIGLRESIDSSESSKITEDKTDRHVVVIRHAERMDFAFGHGWIPVCFKDGTTYTRRDLNQPESVPKRRNVYDYVADSPITVVGHYQASLTGKALRATGMKFLQVYSSPSLRCIQTMSTMLREMNLIHIPINVEPGLFEWLAWYPLGKRPVFLTNQELIENGFNINPTYEPIVNLKECFARESESLTEYYERSFLVVSEILKKSTGNVLILGHASSLDSCTRQMVGEAVRGLPDFTSLIRGIPYCGISMIKEEKDKEANQSSWRLVKPPILTLQHSLNHKYEWKSLKT